MGQVGHWSPIAGSMLGLCKGLHQVQGPNNVAVSLNLPLRTRHLRLGGFSKPPAVLWSLGIGLKSHSVWAKTCRSPAMTD